MCIRDSYNINRLTLKAGKAALEDTDYFDKTRAAIVETRGWTKPVSYTHLDVYKRQAIV